MFYPESFDVIVIGGGHAGTEAALASARIGVNTLLLTHNIETLGQMSCNPAIGGIGKGHLVKEIDALGGLMATAIDHAGIQFRILNRRKGPAVRATRAQADRVLYKQFVRETLENQPNLSLFQQAVDDLIVENHRVLGVITQMGLTFKAKAVVLTVGTFLGGKIHIGLENYAGGRAGDPPANALSQRLRALDLAVGRLKTGTPPRLDGNSIDYSQLVEQQGDQPTPVFSFLGEQAHHPQQVSCYLTYTNEQTHDIIREGLSRSPLYSGVIDSVGPRYCPSIEDKVVRFSEQNSHQIFVEPEGLHTTEIYPNGISTSLPFDVQYQLIHSIKGFEQAKIIRPGYAIEYDFFDPRELQYSLETKAIAGLFFAGQINGTTGYEEAAAQGLVAGCNAARQVLDKEPWLASRDQAYIGVLIDDLISKGTAEPYRMFTSRAEYRLLLREDNADQRLTAIGHELGLVDEQRWQVFSQKQALITQETARLRSTWIHPSKMTTADKTILGELAHEYNLLDLLRRPELSYPQVMRLSQAGEAINYPQVIEQIEIETHYSGYLQRQQQEIDKARRHEATKLPRSMDYAQIKGLSNEVREKLIKIQPQSIGQASRIPGVTPAAIALLLVYLKKSQRI